jgi:hypothetical protein
MHFFLIINSTAVILPVPEAIRNLETSICPQSMRRFAQVVPQFGLYPEIPAVAVIEILAFTGGKSKFSEQG